MSFEGFQLSQIDLTPYGERVSLRVRHGGSGPPLLLLHGHPETHMMWGKIAGDLAKDFTVIAPDLRGYGGSSLPAEAAAGTSNAETSSKRAMARDAIALMKHFGSEVFDVACHDRGARVGYRLALDHPAAVRQITILDIIPTYEVWARLDHRFALGFWHWSFLAQPYPIPETLIGHDPEHFMFKAQFRGAAPEAFAPDAYADYVAAAKRPEVIHGMCECYRAGAGYDPALDKEDKAAGRKIGCPVQVVWGARSGVGLWYDALAIWREWADDLVGQSLDCGHFIPEEKPAETLELLRRFHAQGV